MRQTVQTVLAIPGSCTCDAERRGGMGRPPDEKNGDGVAAPGKPLVLKVSTGCPSAATDGAWLVLCII
jgi:hypothetical protein